MNEQVMTELTDEELREEVIKAVQNLDQNEILLAIFCLELMKEVRGTDLEFELTPDLLSAMGRAAGRACRLIK